MALSQPAVIEACPPPGEEQQPSLYARCRAWMRPDLAAAGLKEQQPAKRLKAAAPKASALPHDSQGPPQYEENFTVTSDNYNARVVLTCLKRHWVAVREHSQAASRARTQLLQQQRMCAALSTVLPNTQPNGKS